MNAALRPVLAAVVCLALAVPALAQDMEARLKAADELLAVTDMQDVLDHSIDFSLAVQLKRHPELEPYKDQLKQFFEKYMGFEAMRGELTSMYAEAFDLDELNDLIAFYRTPTGRKSLKVLPRLLARATDLSGARVNAHQDELHEMLRARAKELPTGEQSPQ